MSVENKISEALQGVFSEVDVAITEVAGEPVGMCLIVFNTEPGEGTSYISNCDRAEVKCC